MAGRFASPGPRAAASSPRGIGECILSEAPLVVGIRRWWGAWAALAAVAAVGWLFAGPGESLFSWAYRCTALIMAKPAVFACYEALRLCASTRVLPPHERGQYLGLYSGLPRYLPALSELRIYRLNAVLGHEAGCVCATVSMVNHSCHPNAAFSWSAGTGHQEVHALRAIARGEEIAASYIDLWQTTEVRLRALRRALGFECDCRSCTAPAVERRRSDDRRARCRELETRVHAELQRNRMPEAREALRELRDTACEELGRVENLITQEMDRSLAELEGVAPTAEG